MTPKSQRQKHKKVSVVKTKERFWTFASLKKRKTQFDLRLQSTGNNVKIFYIIHHSTSKTA